MGYTKGEWKVCYCGQGLTNIVLGDDNDDVIAIVDNSRDNHSPYDAELISAAPAMYEALKEADLEMSYLQRKHRLSGTGKQVLVRIKAVLSKVEKVENKQ